VKKIIIEVPDEFDVKIDLSKGCKVWLEDGESTVGYAKFDGAGKYNLSKGKDELLNLDAVGYTELIGHRQNGDVVLGGDIYAPSSESKTVIAGASPQLKKLMVDKYGFDFEDIVSGDYIVDNNIT